MSKSETLLDRLKRGHIVILLYLYKTRAALMVDLRRAVGRGKVISSYYVEALVSDLKEWGLVEEKRVRNWRFFYLTERGMEVAKALARIAWPEKEEKKE